MRGRPSADLAMGAGRAAYRATGGSRVGHSSACPRRVRPRVLCSSLEFSWRS